MIDGTIRIVRHNSGYSEAEREGFEASHDALDLYCPRIAFTSKELVEPHFPRNPGLGCIVLTMSLHGQSCPQIAAWFESG
jgi:hypothetical protein